MIGSTISHYRILEKLGGGGMGVVYKAEDTSLKRTVALKFLPPDLTRDPDARERFIHEAQAASALDHPNICNIHEVGESADGQTFIVMGFYEGESLKSRISNGQLRIEDALDVASQVAQGLAKAHEKGIVHRDIKPANIMITTDGVAKIVDFGLAKLSGRTLLTKSGTTLGTAAYMSPEQARGEAVDARTDIWSLGVMLYEMLTGKRPFESDYEQALLYSIINQDPRPMKELRPEIPEALEKICQRAMAKAAKDRYQTATELISDLESYKAGTQLSVNTRKVIGKKRRFAYAGLAVALLAIAIVGIIYFTGKGEEFDRVAVLPFENISKDTTGEILAYGLMADLIDKLQQVASLKVPESRTMMRFKGGQLSHAEIARELKAKALVAGSIQPINNQLHVIVKLIDPVADQIVWHETYDADRNDILNLYGKIAQALVGEVRVKISQAERGGLGRIQRKVDPRAYEFYQKGRQHAAVYESDISKSRVDSVTVNYQKAIAIEPDNALYHASLASGYWMALDMGVAPFSEMFPKMKAAAEMALRLDPDLAESQMAGAALDVAERNFTNALSRTSHVLDLVPGNTNARRFLAVILTTLGRLEEALAMLRRAQEQDPIQFRESWGWFNMGMCYYFMRRYDEAIAVFKEGLRQDPKDDPGNAVLALSYSMKGMHAEALAQNYSSPYWGTINRPLLLAKAGERGLATEAFNQIRSKMGPYDKAGFFALMGEKDSAFYWLQRFSEEPGGLVYWLKGDPYTDNLKDDPRFKELLKKMHLSD